MTVRGPFINRHKYIGLSSDTKPTADNGAVLGDEFFESNTRLWYIFDGVSTWSQKVSSTFGPDVLQTVTDPSVSAATTTAIIDGYSGVLITLTTTGNAQTLQTPTVTTAGKRFTVINNDTSTNTISVNGLTLVVGGAATWEWDGSAWVAVGGSGGTVSDYQYIPVMAGMDSIMGAPSAAQKYQGTVGTTIAPTPANVSYGTGTVSAPNFTSMIWGSGTQTATLTCTGLTAGKLYRLQFTPTVTGQVPTITPTSGISSSTIPAVVTTIIENIYFRASGVTAVFTFTNTGASTWSTASTTVFEYTRPDYAREFSNSIQQTLIFDWKAPADWNGGTILIYPKYIVTNGTAPANEETVVFSFSGFCVTGSDSMSQAAGAAVSSTFTADATYVQYDYVNGSVTAAVTLANAAAGRMAKIICDRLTTGTYAQLIGLLGFTVKFTRILVP
jgi:hypothetical protein